MKVTIYSDFLTDYKLPICLEMEKKLGKDFKFISTTKIPQWSLDMGFEDLDSKYDFVVKAYENEKEEVKKLLSDSDIIILETKKDKLIKTLLKEDKIIFRCSYKKNKNLQLSYKNKNYLWGYFPKIKTYDIKQLLNLKEQNEVVNIIWIGRFIKDKHPETMLKIAKKLQKENIKFKIKMFGTGKLFKKIEKKAENKKIKDYVEVLKPVSSEELRNNMEKANIYISTSKENKNWDYSIVEAMNSACVVVANNKSGAVKSLISNDKNGITYNSFDDLFANLRVAIADKNIRRKLSKNAYKTVTENWTCEIATDNLMELFETILKQRKIAIDDGPARIIKK